MPQRNSSPAVAMSASPSQSRPAMGKSRSQTAITVLLESGAPKKLVRIARKRFAANPAFEEGCCALLAQGSAKGVKLVGKSLEADDARVLAWLLARSVGCKVLECVSGASRERAAA